MSQKKSVNFSLGKWIVTCGSVFVALVAASCFKKRPYGPPIENVYRIPVKAKFTSLDPHLTSDLYSSQAQQLVYESLYQFHFLKNEIIPALADSMPKISKDGLKWTIALKKGVRFANDPCFKDNAGEGREVKATDVVYFFERVANKNFGSPVYSGMDTLIKGIEDFRQGRATAINGVKAVDDYTVEIELLRKSPRFIYNFTSTHGALIPKECVEFYGDKINNHAVGTGPFTITKYSPLKVEAVRNPNFRKEVYPSDGEQSHKEAGLLADAGKPIPFIDRVILEAVEEDQPRWLRFMAGDFEQSGVPKDNLNSALPNGKLSEEMVKRGVKHFSAPLADVVVDLFNLDDPVWGKSRDLRRAFALARSIDEMIDVIYVGQAVKAHGLISPFEWGYDPGYKSSLQNENLDEAKKLLAKAGYPEGKGLPPIDYPTLTGATYRQINELKARALSRVGIVLNQMPMSWPEFSARMKEGKFTVVSLGWTGDVPDAESSLPMFHSRAIPPHGQNYSRYRNKEYDKLVEDIEVMEATDTRYKKIRRAAQMLEEDVVIAPVVHRVGNQFFQPWVKNVMHTEELRVVQFIKYRRVEYGDSEKASNGKK